MRLKDILSCVIRKKTFYPIIILRNVNDLLTAKTYKFQTVLSFSRNGNMQILQKNRINNIAQGRKGPSKRRKQEGKSMNDRQKMGSAT